MIEIAGEWGQDVGLGSLCPIPVKTMAQRPAQWLISCCRRWRISPFYILTAVCGEKDY